MENVAFEGLNESVRLPAPAISKAARILKVAAANRESLGVSEIARETGLSKSTVHGLVTALCAEGFMTMAEESRGYALGPLLTELGAKALDAHVLSAAEVELDQLALQPLETALFGRLVGERVMVMARRESSRVLNLSAPLDSRIPVTAGALGKAYLASLPRGSLASQVRKPPFHGWIAVAKTSLLEYVASVEDARDVGYAMDRGEYLPGIVAVAAAFRWSGSVYFVWIAGIDALYDADGLRQRGESVREACAALTERLEAGYVTECQRGAR